MDRIEQQVWEFVVSTFLKGNSDAGLKGDMSFARSGLIDSFGIVNLVSFVEKQYSISVANDDLQLDAWDSINGIASYVRNKLSR